MAIKFHCPHCRQLLGISTTKAGTLVDCPACGRSVLVPNDGGMASGTKQARRPGDHPGLLNALQELSALGSPEAGDSAPLILPELPEHDLTSALRELAAAAPVALQPQEKQTQPTAARQSATGRFSLVSLMFVLPAFAAGLLLGTFWRSSDHPDAAKADPQSTVAHAAAIPLPAPSERQLRGVVRFVNDSGNSAADAGAIVLLLPTENATTLRLDARPLRESADSKARQAIEAALETLGGSVHQADAAGTWSANVPANVALTMIVISRHRARTDSQPVPATILESLSRWFDSPIHITGRLAVMQSLVPAGSGSDNQHPESLEMEFSAKQ
jgi:ribosomal protein S27E